jgi:hypothetical protein
VVDRSASTRSPAAEPLFYGGESLRVEAVLV